MEKSELVNRNKANNAITPKDGVIDGAINVTEIEVPETEQSITSANMAFGLEIADIPNKYYIQNVIFNIKYKASSSLLSTPLIGIGTVKATGVLDDFTTIPTAIDIVDEFSGTRFNGSTEVTTEVVKSGKSPNIFAKGKMFLNFAGSYNTIDSKITYSGTITLIWSPIK